MCGVVWKQKKPVSMGGYKLKVSMNRSPAYRDRKNLQSIFSTYFLASVRDLRIACRNESITRWCFCLKRDLPRLVKIVHIHSGDSSNIQRFVVFSFPG